MQYFDGYPSQVVKDQRAERTYALTPRDASATGCASRVQRLNRNLMELIGIEPTTSGLQNRRSPN